MVPVARPTSIGEDASGVQAAVASCTNGEIQHMSPTCTSCKTRWKSVLNGAGDEGEDQDREGDRSEEEHGYYRAIELRLTATRDSYYSLCYFCLVVFVLLQSRRMST